MQFFATFALLIVAVSALPAANPIEEGSIFKRTCGTLSGTALTVCQEACLAACVCLLIFRFRKLD
jgi:hypothetical protein